MNLKRETIRSLVVVVLYTVILCGGASLLAGCSRNDLEYAGCLVRDNTSRPCN